MINLACIMLEYVQEESGDASDRNKVISNAFKHERFAKLQENLLYLLFFSFCRNKIALIYKSLHKERKDSGHFL